MKILIRFSLIFLCSVSQAQDIKLENFWVKGSDKIYIGVTNYLRIQGDVNAITKIDCNVGIQRQHDTLLVLPTTGRVKITIYTTYTETSYFYDAISMPLPTLSFTCVDLKKVAPTVRLTPALSDDLFSHYKIIQYTILIGDKERTSHTDYLTAEILAAIDQIPEGKKFHISNLVFWNKETNHYIDVNPAISFGLDYEKKGTNNFTNSCIAGYITQ